MVHESNNNSTEHWIEKTHLDDLGSMIKVLFADTHAEEGFRGGEHGRYNSLWNQTLSYSLSRFLSLPFGFSPSLTIFIFGILSMN